MVDSPCPFGHLYARVLKQQGARVIVECQSPLERILQSCDGIDMLIPRGATRPVFDVYAPLMSLPFLLGTTLGNIPTPIPYLRAEDELAHKWQAELDHNRRARLQIGVCWRGHPKNKADARRSFALKHLAPVAQLPDVELICLQRLRGRSCQLRSPEFDVALAEFEAAPFPIREIPALDEHTGPFMDTAAILTQLDLLISCDSSVAHLAGSLNIPVWLALPYSAEWRWLRGRDDSPWYPRHRLFRQTTPGDWSGVFARIATELATFQP